METKVVGRVVGVFRYPVKSMAGEELQAADVGWSGVDGDRRYAYVKADGLKAAQIDFPWFTGREYPALVTYQAKYQPNSGKQIPDVCVTTPDGSEFPIESDALNAHLAQQYGKPVSLLRLGRGTYDGMPLSILSTRTVADTARAAGIPDTNPHRYRPNILIDLEPDTHEDQWTGRALAIGENALKIWVTSPDPRCMMINLDPATGTQNPQVLRYVATMRAKELAMYATVIAEGQVRLGDEIRLISSRS